MINNIKIKSGVLHDLLGKRDITFDPGMNILWGKNGSGKSLLLKTIGSYCFVEQVGGGGWSQDSRYTFRYSDYDFEYKHKGKSLSDVFEFDRDSKLDIEWSGDPSFYMHHDDMLDEIHIMGYEMTGSKWINGIGKIMPTVVKPNNYHPSSGQLIKGIIEMLLKIETPNLTVNKDPSRGYDSNFVSYIKRRKKDFKGEFKPTLLLDELDSQFDLSNQIWFHEEVIPQLLKKYQVILASHSIFATKYTNIIELDNSLQFVKDKLKAL